MLFWGQLSMDLFLTRSLKCQCYAMTIIQLQMSLSYFQVNKSEIKGNLVQVNYFQFSESVWVKW